MQKTDGNTGTPNISEKRFIEVQNLYKSFRNTGAPIEILKNVHLSLGEGDTLAIVGASGIGKSTFLHILGTLDRPDSGKLFFQGEDVLLYDNNTLARFRNRSVGFMFQFHHLLPEFSALENASMPALIHGYSKEKAREAAEIILVRTGLKDRLQHRVGKLSGGEQQRVALARALVMRPRLLLADEPTGNLDTRNSDQVHELLLELNQEFSMTMVVVTHNMQLAAFMSRCVTIADGQFVEKR
ncbi:MAG: ABC transporter ATP-binding protein [Deltaproteobacteria bacterium]|nr:ABC transporter ATP-binding protein [Deltaproteobacteria bacterium]